MIVSMPEPDERMEHPHVVHATPQARLQRLRMPPPHKHHHRPTQTSKRNPPILHQLFPQPTSIIQQTPPASTALHLSHVPGLHGQLRQRQHHAREDVYDDLLGHRVVYRASEDGVAAEQAGKERVVVALFAVGRGVSEEQHGALVDEGEEAEVARVLARGFEDEPAF